MIAENTHRIQLRDKIIHQNIPLWLSQVLHQFLSAT